MEGFVCRLGRSMRAVERRVRRVLEAQPETGRGRQDTGSEKAHRALPPPPAWPAIAESRCAALAHGRVPLAPRRRWHEGGERLRKALVTLVRPHVITSARRNWPDGPDISR